MPYSLHQDPTLLTLTKTIVIVSVIALILAPFTEPVSANGCTATENPNGDPNLICF